MSMLGAPWLQINRKTQRAEINPMDKCTVVSIYPKDILEVKSTIQPGRFHLKPGSYDKPSILVVGTSSWWKELDLEQPLLEIPVSSMLIANSIVQDYCGGMMGVDLGDSMPGLFFVPGELTVEVIKKDHKDKLELANVRQKSWYKRLIEIADVLWARTNGNPLSISNDARLAAQELGIKDKPWMKDFNTLELKPCPSCGVLRNSEFPVCQHCKVVIDVKKFESLGLKFAS